MEKLGKLGKMIIGKFIDENKEREKLYSQKEKEIIEYKKSRRNMDMNKWRYSSHNSGYFENLKIDEVLYFKKEPKPDYLIKSPFKIPKKEGYYFNNIYSY
jgi:hypothetical protein